MAVLGKTAGLRDHHLQWIDTLKSHFWSFFWVCLNPRWWSNDTHLQSLQSLLIVNACVPFESSINRWLRGFFEAKIKLVNICS